LLQWQMIERLKERGCQFYDLGGINPETNPGVYHFKSGFSGEDVSFIPRFELSGSALSAFVVGLGERVREMRHRRKNGEDGDKPQESSTGNTAGATAAQRNS
jgi:lipid II:glycine glycyltransferase (peptidoglycan interpeptide bridge formation enzyme)